MNELVALERASALCDLHRWDNAVSHLRTFLATDPHNEVGLCLMAQAQFGQGALDESLRTSLTAISENPENEWAHRLASLALLALGRHAEARVMARDAVRLAPNLAVGHINLASMLANSEPDLTEAREAAERAVVLAPHEADSHMAVGTVAMADGRTGEAKVALERALALEPDHDGAHHELARLQLTILRPGNAGGLAKAAGGFAAALRANPDASVSRYNFDLVLHMFLIQTAYWIFFAAWVGRAVSSSVDAELARVVPAVLLVFPAFFAIRFVFALAPQLRGHLSQALRRPVNISAAICDLIAAATLVVGATFQRSNPGALWCAIGFSIVARVILWQQTRSRFGLRGKAARAMWWIATAVLIVMSQLAFGPLPNVVSSTELYLRGAAAIGCVVLVYAVHRRRTRA